MHEYYLNLPSKHPAPKAKSKPTTSFLKKKPGILGTDKEFLNSIIISVLHLQKLKILII